MKIRDIKKIEREGLIETYHSRLATLRNLIGAQADDARYLPPNPPDSFRHELGIELVKYFPVWSKEGIDIYVPREILIEQARKMYDIAKKALIDAGVEMEEDNF